MKLGRLSTVVLSLIFFFGSLANVALAESVREEPVDLVEDREVEAERRQQERLRQLDRFYEIYTYLNEYHVDNPSAEELMDDAISGMLFFMDDPYTTYMNEEEYQAFLNSVNGAFVGIGIYVSLTEDGVVIQGLLPEGPAARAGLMAGDIILEVDGGELRGFSVEEATDSILGQEGTEVELTIARQVDEEEAILTYTLVREKLQLPHVELDLLDRHTAHLKLLRFGSETYDIIKRELERIEQLGVESIILDLRGNSGGMMDAVIDIASLFRESGVIFHTRDNAGRIESYELSEGQDWQLPMVVLIDFYSASAAEVLAGFLQDYELATIVGEDSFGKGRIQTSIELEHGGMLHISIEEYFTPRLKPVQGVGIQPDVFIREPALQVAKAYGILHDLDEIALYKDGEMTFNRLRDEQFEQYAYQEQGEWYLSVRMLSDWYGGSLEWDWDEEQIKLELFGDEYRLAKHDPHLRFIDDRAYLALEYMLLEMPLQLDEQDDQLRLTRE